MQIRILGFLSSLVLALGHQPCFASQTGSASDESQMRGLFEFAITNRAFFQKYVINPQPIDLKSKHSYSSFSTEFNLALEQVSSQQPSIDCRKLPERMNRLRTYLDLALYNRQIFRKDFPNRALFNTLKIHILSQYLQSLLLFTNLKSEGGRSLISGQPIACHFKSRAVFTEKFQLSIDHLQNYLAREIGLLNIERNQWINEQVLPFMERNLENFNSQDRKQTIITNAGIFFFPGMIFATATRLIAWTTVLAVGSMTGYQWTRPYEKEAGSSQIPLFYSELVQSIDFLSRAEHPYEFYIQYFRMTLGLQKNMQVLFQQLELRFGQNFEKALEILKQKKGESHD